MYTFAVGIPEEKGPFLGSVPWLVFGTAPMIFSGPFEQMWSWDGALGLSQTTWTDWSAGFGVGALSFVGLSDRNTADWLLGQNGRSAGPGSQWRHK